MVKKNADKVSRATLLKNEQGLIESAILPPLRGIDWRRMQKICQLDDKLLSIHQFWKLIEEVETEI